MTIKILPSHIVDQIAAGEVVERPAAVVKELIENSIDAGASKIEVAISNGGKSFIAITDDGCGIKKDDLPIAITRHATSKLNTDDLFDINYLGFRGEALPSIASVSRFKLISKVEGCDAYEINIEGGKVGEVRPSSLNKGTRIEARDLFYSVPARLKFLKADGTETSHIIDVINRIALCYPLISFNFLIDNKPKLSYQSGSFENRIAQVMGKDFSENTRKIEYERGDFKLLGYVSLPTFTKGSSASQYMFVNGRSVKDKLLYGAIRAGYEGYIGRDIFPVAVIFLQVSPKEVDVNVHPAKTEVRFRESGMIRGGIISAIRAMLEDSAGDVATTVKHDAVASFLSSQYKSNTTQRAFDYNEYNKYKPIRECSYKGQSISNDYTYKMPIENKQEEEEKNYPLGFAKAQLFTTYIVSQSDDGIVITDQHASHERLTYEKLIENFRAQISQTQMLLIPEVVDLSNSQYDAILHGQEELKNLGIILDKFGESSIIVRELPQILGQVDIKQLVIEIADGLIEMGTNTVIRDKIKDICAIMSCHGSIRAGRKLSVDEMNALLREIENNPNTAQCIHGRPTYIKLELKDIEKLFGRR